MTRKPKQEKSNTKPASANPSIMDMVEDSLLGLGKVMDVKTTIREFNKLKFPEPKPYGSKEIIKLREKKLHMSQAAFAAVVNAKLPPCKSGSAASTNPPHL